MYGRSVIYTDELNIDRNNLLNVLHDALPIHEKNRSEIQKLWDIYRGKTDILNKVKEVRPEINHKICENRAYEIVNFYTGYVFGEPIQYIHRGECGKDEAVQRLNEAMDSAGKEARDNELAEWLYVCGVGYRLALADRDPMGVYTLDPRTTFVVRHSGPAHQVVMGVSVTKRRDSGMEITCYTEKAQFVLKAEPSVAHLLTAEAPLTLPADGMDFAEKPNILGIPIVEYTANAARLGVFEPVIPLLNALNDLQSNRLDDVEATVNAFLVLLGASMEEGQYQQLREEKMLSLPNGTDAKYLVCNLDQSSVQELKEDLYESILTICGMPNRNGGTSTSDTGTAVMLRDGWQSAEARAKHTESLFKDAEREFLAVALRILNGARGMKLGLKPSDIIIKFTRRNYDNLQTKAQVLTEMLACDKIHPETAFVSCGLFIDPMGEYRRGQEWYEQNRERDQVSQVRETAADAGREGDGRDADQVSEVSKTS